MSVVEIIGFVFPLWLSLALISYRYGLRLCVEDGEIKADAPWWSPEKLCLFFTTSFCPYGVLLACILMDYFRLLFGPKRKKK